MDHKFVLNRAGLGELMSSPAAAAALAPYAEQVAAQVPEAVIEPGVSPGGGSVPARARVRVGYPASMPPAQALNTEAKHGYLARALAAARGGQ